VGSVGRLPALGRLPVGRLVGMLPVGRLPALGRLPVGRLVGMLPVGRLPAPGIFPVMLLALGRDGRLGVPPELPVGRLPVGRLGAEGRAAELVTQAFTPEAEDTDTDPPPSGVVAEPPPEPETGMGDDGTDGVDTQWVPDSDGADGNDDVPAPAGSTLPMVKASAARPADPAAIRIPLLMRVIDPPRC